ncbi:hypothetical protein SAY87_032370 [Trapa incisa]|uniref:Uncharacterized protein n=1 Tax=Trapa incisa TaxID=236973 RepID=A0AAN7GJF2_9MYRT|nr:hypothetical protein SAY87_032370 [Trapa incisa]
MWVMKQFANNGRPNFARLWGMALLVKSGLSSFGAQTRVHQTAGLKIMKGGYNASLFTSMPNGSVDNHLSARHGKTLSWARRLRIAQDTARGLAYLHEEMDFQVAGTIGYAAPEYIHTGLKVGDEIPLISFRSVRAASKIKSDDKQTAGFKSEGCSMLLELVRLFFVYLYCETQWSNNKQKQQGDNNGGKGKKSHTADLYY